MITIVTDEEFSKVFIDAENKGLAKNKNNNVPMPDKKRQWFEAFEEMFVTVGSGYKHKVGKGEIVVRLRKDTFVPMPKSNFETDYVDVDTIPKQYTWHEQKDTVDGIITFVDTDGVGKIVLITREYAPKGLALPGGLVDPGEESKTAFVREMEEELNVTLSNYSFFDTFHAREPRGTIRTAVYVAKANQTPKAGDDAASVVFLTMEELKHKIKYNSHEFAFDHHIEILSEWME